MRSRKALINALAGMAGYAVVLLSNFITRGVLVRQLGLDAVGLETTFRNIISMMALAELGIGTGLVYKLYRPIAEGDKVSIRRILNFYGYAYRRIAAVILSVGVILAFFVPLFVEEAYDPLYLGVIFLLFVGDTVSSYLFADRKALLVADQKNYLVNINDASVQVMSLVLQVATLLIFKQFWLYVGLKIVCRVIGACLIARRFRKQYPDIAADRDRTLPSPEERKPLTQNMGAMLCHKVGGFSVTATGSAIMTKFLGLTASGMYGNYYLITSTLSQVITQIFNGITASFGSLMTDGNEKAVYEKFNVLYFVNFWIYSFCTVSAYVVFQPFITLWVGADSLLDRETLLVMMAFFYVNGMRRVIMMARDSTGMYRPDRYLALVEAALNIGLSVWFVQLWGIKGVVFANTLSMLLIPMWTQPYLVYKRILHRPVLAYYGRYVVYLAVTVGCLMLTSWMSGLIAPHNGLTDLLIRAGLCAVLPNAVILVLFHRTKEFGVLWGTLRNLFKGKKREGA